MSTLPPTPRMLNLFRESGGGEKVAHAGTKVCYGEDEAECRRLAHRTWPNESLPGELAQELPTVAHFEQATSIVTEDMVAQGVVCGPDPERHKQNIQEYVDAGYDEVYVQQIGPNQKAFFDFYQREILPEFR